MALKSKVSSLSGDSSSSSTLYPSASLVTSSAASSPLSSLFPVSMQPAGFSTTLFTAVVPQKHQKVDEHDCVHGWLETMKASSPPRKEHLNDNNLDEASFSATKALYYNWMEEHPSALDKLEDIAKEAEKKQVAVFLDYDGTLSPIVEDPDQAYMSDEMRSTIRKVATYFPTAIITGRRRDKVYDFVQLAELYYAGSHGMDIMGPAEGCNGVKANGFKDKNNMGNDIVFFQPASEFLAIMDKVYKELIIKVKDVEGAKVEHNKFCVTVHFRCVKEENWSTLAEIVQTVLQKYPDLSLIQGRKVLEFRPAIEWHKGKALEFLLKSLGLENTSDVLPLYIGDDRTDEDAFNILRDRGIGYSILVSTVAKATSASYSLRDPSEVMIFLQGLVNWRALQDGNLPNGCAHIFGH
ncbi:hypothetical protein O6H91_15G059100 [Diphasiastrum complanatum]|uniref:Uncharacterized protein n=1 Tax=Diphasiastrum complanatum TaxID=34168 RepID=A0ACC2BIS8_DIPCM|nr:hypothetical protein O6H91_15G059100 [Diphasiastrum complanatum]